MVESILDTICLIEYNNNTYGGVCISENGLIATVFRQPTTPITVQFHGQTDKKKAEIFICFPQFGISILHLPECEHKKMKFKHVEVPEDIDLGYGNELVSFSHCPFFSASFGVVSYPLPARTPLPEVNSSFDPNDIDTRAAINGYVPCVKVKFGCVRECRNLNPELPLILASGVCGDDSSLGCPLFDEKNLVFVGIFLKGGGRGSRCSFYVPATMISKALKDVQGHEHLWGFRLPFLGMEVANLYEADLIFPEQFRTRFHNISTAVIITMVEEDSPASRSGICTNDVIVKLEGKLVQSKSEFYETVWEKAGKSVELNVFRVTDGEELNLSLVIGKASPKIFHHYLRILELGASMVLCLGFGSLIVVQSCGIIANAAACKLRNQSL